MSITSISSAKTLKAMPQIDHKLIIITIEILKKFSGYFNDSDHPSAFSLTMIMKNNLSEMKHRL